MRPDVVGNYIVARKLCDEHFSTHSPPDAIASAPPKAQSALGPPLRQTIAAVEDCSRYAVRSAALLTRNCLIHGNPLAASP